VHEPQWIDRAVVEQLHADSLLEFGGATGLRNEDGLESALARPINRHLYESVDDPFELAAEYAFGLMRNHPFVDGNKRAGLLAAGAFLNINGWEIDADETEVANACLLLASGEWCVAEFAFWLRENCIRA
jgi:death-on-curing protein